MSTREIAYSIFEQLSEEQLKGFIALFKGVYPSKSEANDMEKRTAAFERLEKMCKYIYSEA